MHQKASWCDTHLASIAEFGSASRFHSERYIGVVANDHWRVAAQLHGDALHVLTSHASEHFSNWGGASEADLANGGVLDQIAGNFGWHAIEQVDHTSWQASINKALEKHRRRCRRFFGRFDDDGATRCERCTDFAHNLVDRKIPRRESSHHAHRLLEHLHLRVHRARRHDAAINAAAFISQPVERVH